MCETNSAADSRDWGTIVARRRERWDNAMEYWGEAEQSKCHRLLGMIRPQQCLLLEGGDMIANCTGTRLTEQYLER